MTTEQKLQALQALSGVSGCSIHMRKPGDWYLHLSGIGVGGNRFLSGLAGNGRTPYAAIDATWDRLVTSLPPDKYINIGGISSTRRKVRWAGFMWQDVT